MEERREGDKSRWGASSFTIHLLWAAAEGGRERERQSPARPSSTYWQYCSSHTHTHTRTQSTAAITTALELPGRPEGEQSSFQRWYSWGDLPHFMLEKVILSIVMPKYEYKKNIFTSSIKSSGNKNVLCCGWELQSFMSSWMFNILVCHQYV